jgi:hypothetical protein
MEHTPFARRTVKLNAPFDKSLVAGRHQVSVSRRLGLDEFKKLSYDSTFTKRAEGMGFVNPKREPAPTKKAPDWRAPTGGFSSCANQGLYPLAPAGAG